MNKYILRKCDTKFKKWIIYKLKNENDSSIMHIFLIKTKKTRLFQNIIEKNQNHHK